MDSILFIVMIGCFALVAIWYVGNEAAGAAGAWGLLGIEGPSPSRPSQTGYQARRGVEPNEARAPQAGAPSPRVAPVRALRFREKPSARFNDRDETRYHARGPLPRFGESERPGPGSERPS